jgi:hypothetical protein
LFPCARSTSPPRENNNKLLAVPRGITLHALRRRLADLRPSAAGGGNADASSSSDAAAFASLRYRLPGEAEGSPEALVELSSDEDLALMLEEYDALQARAPHGGPDSRLHVYVSASAAVSPSPSASPPSPRSVLRRWRVAAATLRRKASQSPPRGRSSENAKGTTTTEMQTQTQTQMQAPLPALPASLTGDLGGGGGNGGGFASMLSLAEAVVADVLSSHDGADAAAAAAAAAARSAHAASPPPAPSSPPQAPPPPAHMHHHAPLPTLPAALPSSPHAHPHAVLPGIRGVQHIAADDMELGPRIGDGTYAVVHGGWWRGASVAVKILRTPSHAPSDAAAARGAARAVAAFAREAGLLARLQHPNVLALYGVVAPGAGPPAAVLELMPHGSLRAALRARPRPPLRTAATLALGAARAMQHLHAQSPPIVHFDLKADNLLVDWRDAAAPVCKLADLGLACAVASSSDGVGSSSSSSGGVCVSGGDASGIPALAAAPTHVAGRGTLWWMAPELFPDAPHHSAFTAAAAAFTAAAAAPPAVDVRIDVFSFGVVMWEIATGGGEPYGASASPEAVMAAVRAGARPPLPHGCDARWAALMHACWAASPAARPTFAEIVPMLARMAHG